MYCKNYLVKHLKTKVSIELPANTSSNGKMVFCMNNNKKSLKDRYFYAMDLYNNGISKSASCKQANIDIRLFNRLLPFDNEEILKYFKSKKEIAHEEKTSSSVCYALISEMEKTNGREKGRRLWRTTILESVTATAS